MSPDFIPDGLAVYKVNVTRTHTYEDEYWIVAKTEEEARESAEEAFDGDWRLCDYDADTEVWISRNRPVPQDGDEVLWEGRTLTWPIPLEEELTEHERRALEIRLSIHPSQGRFET